MSSSFLLGQITSTYLTIAITLERFVAVHWPLKARTMCTIQTARITTVLIFVFSVLYGTPIYFSVYAAKVPTPSEMKQKYKIAVTALVNTYEYQIYYYWGFFICSFLIPLITLIIFNTAIYIRVLYSRNIIYLLPGLE